MAGGLRATERPAVVAPEPPAGHGLSKEREIFEKEYNDFLISEFVLQKMEDENISVRTLAKKAGVSPTIIQKKP
jgi:hypothetical protein